MNMHKEAGNITKTELPSTKWRRTKSNTESKIYNNPNPINPNDPNSNIKTKSFLKKF